VRFHPRHAEPGVPTGTLAWLSQALPPGNFSIGLLENCATNLMADRLVRFDRAEDFSNMEITMTSANNDKTRRKFCRERAVGRYLLNPAVKGLSRLGLRPTLATELETVGRDGSGTARPCVGAIRQRRGVGQLSARHPLGFG